MRSLVAAFLLVLCLTASAAQPRPPTLVGKAWLVADLTSGQLLAAHKADERFEPASLAKLMTAYVVFTALRDKKLSLDQQVKVSPSALKVSGGRMYLDARRPVTVDELIRGMAIQSANDASIALAEAVAGSEDAFARLMNREVARLGMKNTHFMNATGLPDAQQYSSAQDLYLLTAALIRDFPNEYGQYYSQKEFRYNNISQPNRNRLLWVDPSVDGVKTGQTEAAGYCLIASSRRGGRRLLTVLLGSTSEATRAQESLRLLNWGYQFYDGVKLYSAGTAVKQIDVWKGASRHVNVGVGTDLIVSVPKGEADKLRAELVSQQPLVAPLAKGQRVGVLRVTHDGKPFAEYPLIALEPVAQAGFFGRTWDTLRLWLK